MEESLFLKAFKILGDKPWIKVLDYLIAEPKTPFYKNEVVDKTKVSRITVTKILHRMESKGIIKKHKKIGNAVQYMLNVEHPTIKALIEFDLKLSKEHSIKSAEKIPA